MRLADIGSFPAATLPPTAPVGEALSLMDARRISSVVVADGSRPVGIFTERDLVRLVGEEADLQRLPLERAMGRPPVTAHLEDDYLHAYHLFIEHRIRHLIVVDHDQRCLGVVSETDIQRHLGIEHFIHVKEVREVMTAAVVACYPDDAVETALGLMRDDQVSCVVVTDREERPLGILTERDLVRLARGELDVATPVREVMSAPVEGVGMETAVRDVADRMARRSIRRLVVTDERGRVAGVVTEHDVVHALEPRYIDYLRYMVRSQGSALDEARERLNEGTVLSNLFRSTIDMAMVVATPDGRIQFRNPLAEALFNPRGEWTLEGRHLRTLYPRSTLYDEAMDALRAGHATELLVEMGAAPRNRFVRYRLGEIHDDEGERLGLAVLAKEVTGQVKAERALDERLAFETLLSDLSATFVNPPEEEVEQRVSYWLQRIITTLRIERGTLFLLDDGEVLTRFGPTHGPSPHPCWASAEYLNEVPRRLREGGELSIIDWRLHCDGDEEPAPGEPTTLLLPITIDDEVSGGLVFDCARDDNPWDEHSVQRLRLVARIFTNVLAHKRTAQALRRAEEEAMRHRDQLAHLTRAHTMNELAANIAHEINQPLGAIVGYCSAAARRARTGEVEHLVELVEKIAAQAERAGGIISSLRSMVGRKEPVLRETELNELVEKALGLTEPEAKYRGCRLERFTAPGPLRVEGDAVQLQQVVINLLRNAIEAFPAGPDAADRYIRVITHRADADTLEVRVVDNGPGVDQMLRDTLFDGVASDKASGMGLGLAICRSIVEAHGGEIGYRPNPGGGALFHFTLPAPPKAPTVVPTIAGATAGP